MEDTWLRTHRGESPHHFSTENGSQCKRMTHELFGNLIGSFVWRVVLLEARGFCGEGHPELREKEKGKPMRKMHFDCHILICGIVFWTGSFVVSSKFQLKSQLEIAFVSCTWVLYHLNIFICGLMEIVRRCNKPAHRPVITHNRCLYCSRQFFALIIQKSCSQSISVCFACYYYVNLHSNIQNNCNQKNFPLGEELHSQIRMLSNYPASRNKPVNTVSQTDRGRLTILGFLGVKKTKNSIRPTSAFAVHGNLTMIFTMI